MIDFDPIVYTRFEGSKERKSWGAGTRCLERPLVLYPHVPRTFRYRTTALPEPRPGQPAPASSGETEFFLADTRDANRIDARGVSAWSNERPDHEKWKEVLSEAIHPKNVRLAHDPAAKTITVELMAPVSREEALHMGLLVGTPSADGRRFGTDCVSLTTERNYDSDPYLQTVLDGLPKRDRPSSLRSRCSDSHGDMLRLVRGVTRTVKYQTTVWPKADPELPVPRAKGQADAFLIDAGGIEEMQGEPLPFEWEALREKAVHPREVKLEHDPAKKAVTMKLTGSLEGKYALVVGTVSDDGRFFGVDCARLAEEPAPEPPLLQTQFLDLPPRGKTHRAQCGLGNPVLLSLSLNETQVVRYHTFAAPTPESELPYREYRMPSPEPAGPADVFLVDGATASEIGERASPEEWKRLKSRAIHPVWLELMHDPQAKAITFKMTRIPQGEYALVAATPAAESRPFGLDCIRLDTRVTALAPGGTKPP